MDIKPLWDRVLLKWIEKENMTSSGIYIPESTNKERPYMYEVISVWPWKENVSMTVQSGDKVLCGQYAWDEIKIDDTDYKIIAMEYILAIVE